MSLERGLKFAGTRLRSILMWTLFAWSYLSSVASQVYKGALYLYAAEGIIPEPYNREMLDMAWKFKKS